MFYEGEEAIAGLSLPVDLRLSQYSWASGGGSQLYVVKARLQLRQLKGRGPAPRHDRHAHLRPRHTQ